MPIAYKGLVHTKDTKAGHTERFSILQQKNMEGCTQLIPRAGQPLEFFMAIFQTSGLAYSPLNSAKLSCSSEVTLVLVLLTSPLLFQQKKCMSEQKTIYETSRLSVMKWLKDFDLKE